MKNRKRKIGHVGVFAPNRCGLYEASRDMIRADNLNNDVVYVDSGITEKGIKQAGVIGAIDSRGGYTLKTSPPEALNDCDVIIMHTGCNDHWLVTNQAPLIWVVHGRPLACFRPERYGTHNSFSLYNTVAKWKRTKYMLYFWESFRPYWSRFFDDKDLVINPVIDHNRFEPSQPINLKSKGEINVLICDSEREDKDNFELTIGLIEIAKKHRNVKFHYVGMDLVNCELPNCWNLVLGELKKLNALGDVYGRIGDMEKVYSAMDLTISPNRILTRTIMESLACGVPVISQNNKLDLFSDYTCDMSDPSDLLEAYELFVDDYEDGINENEIIQRSYQFSMNKYRNSMDKIYNELTHVETFNSIIGEIGTFMTKG